MSTEARLAALEKEVVNLALTVGKSNGKASSTYNLTRFVILPLIVILGGLIGIKLW